MYYSELIQRFWDCNEKASMGSTATAMYLYLLKLANDKDEYVVSVSDAAVSRVLGITRKTVKAARDRLGSIGVVEYGVVNGVPRLYRIILHYPMWEAEPGYVAGGSNRDSATQEGKGKEANKESELKPSQNADCQQNDPGEEDKKVLKCHDVPQQPRHNRQGSPVSEKENLLTDPLHTAVSPSYIPTLAEFLDYAQGLDAFVPPLYDKLTEKYHSWKDRGWKNNSGRMITNWQVAIKQLLPYMGDGIRGGLHADGPIPKIKVPEELERKRQH